MYNKKIPHVASSCSAKALEIAERLSELEKAGNSEKDLKHCEAWNVMQEKDSREAELLAEPWLSLHR